MKGNFAFPLSLVGFLVCVLSVGFISSVISTSAHAQSNAATLQNIIVNNPSHTGTSMFATFHKAAEDAGWATFRGDEGWSSENFASAANALVDAGLLDAETGYSTAQAHENPITTAGFYNAGDTIQIQFVFDVDVFVHKDLRLQLHFDGASRWFSLDLDLLTGLASTDFADSHYTAQPDNTYYQTTNNAATLTFEYDVSSADNDNDFNGINTALDRRGFFAIAQEDLTQGEGWSTQAGPNLIKSEREAAIVSVRLLSDDPLPWNDNRWEDHATTPFYSTEARYGADYFYVYAPSVSGGVNTYSHGVDTFRASTFVYKFPSTETIETGDFEIEIKFSNSGAGAGGTSTIAETTRDDSFTAEDFVFKDSEGMELNGWTVSNPMFHALDMKQPSRSNQVRRSAAYKVYRATITPPLDFDGDVEITVPENATMDIAGNMSQASEALTVSVNTVRDAALLAGIREELGIPAGTTVTPADMLRLTSLDLSGSDVSDLTFLQSATNLEELDLSDTEVSDISALSSLTSLVELSLSGTPVEDITPLSNLTNLKVLDLSDTEVSDISALSSTN